MQYLEGGVAAREAVAAAVGADVGAEASAAAAAGSETETTPAAIAFSCARYSRMGRYAAATHRFLRSEPLYLKAVRGGGAHIGS